MATATATLQLHHREVFERDVSRALLAGGLAGAAHLGAAKLSQTFSALAGVAMPVGVFPASEWSALLPLSYATIAGVAIASAKGDRLDRWLLIGLGAVLPALPWLFGLSTAWTLALSGATAGALMVRSHLSHRGEEGSVGGDRPGLINYLLGAALTGGLAVAGTYVVKALGYRLLQLSTPPLLAVIAAGVVLALFVGLGSIASHVALRPDPVEARCAEVIPELGGELKELATRALALYQQCGKSLAELPRETAREEMARTLAKMTRETVDLAAEWSGLEAQLQSGAAQDFAAQQADLARSARAARDPVARQQLELAAAALAEETKHLEELALQRERVVARLKAQVALLERARVTLIGLRGGQVQLKAAELSAIARRFQALASLQSAEARLAGEVATSAELAQAENAQAVARVTAVPEGAAGPAAEEPVAAEPVAAEVVRLRG